MNQDYSMKYGDFLRECGHFDPGFMLSAHLSTVRSFCISLPKIIDLLTPRDMDDFRSTLIDWLEEDDARFGEILKEGSNNDVKPKKFQSNRTVFETARNYLEKEYSKRQSHHAQAIIRKTPQKNQPCPVCKWYHEKGNLTSFSSGKDKIIIHVEENSTPHTILNMLHSYMEDHEWQYMPKRALQSISSLTPYDMFRSQIEVWGMIECRGGNIRIAPPNQYTIQKRQKKSSPTTIVKNYAKNR